MTLRFVWERSFERDWRALGFDAEDLRALEIEILRNPKRWPVIKGCNGVRKLRFARPGAGKSGGCRVCYVHFERWNTACVLIVYPKNVREDLTPDDRRTIAAIVAEIETSLERMEKRR
ncbi:MAG TPA: addiction module toxin RelE [Planctomycetia bacterium]|jgi:hypothetical protein|nr:addiction module toxin RelE [Planctomycetia bacterium]